MKKRLIIYLACLFACLIASCSEKDEVISNGGEPQSYVPFAINKGVNISNWLSQVDAIPANGFSQAEAQKLAGYGFDHIRLPINEKLFFTEDGQKIPEAFTLLHNAIGWCRDAGMKVIVDLHVLRDHNFNTTVTTSGDPIESFYDTFEDMKWAGWFANGPGVTVNNVDNPSKSGINTSNRVFSVVRKSGVDTWSNAKKKDFSIIPVGSGKMQFKYLRAKIYKSTKSTITVVLSDENNTNDGYYGYTNTTANEWEEIAVDVSNYNKNCGRVALRPEEGETMYFDDVFFSDSKTGDNKIYPESGTTTVVPKLWTDKDAQYKYLDLWKTLAEELNQYPNDLVAYELLNEPVAPYASQWNSLSAQLIRELRQTEPERKLIIGSNRWQSVNTFNELTIPGGDPNIILSFHFYNPHPLTHYQAEWTEEKDLNVPIHYPGELIEEADFNQLSEAMQKLVTPYMGTYDKTTLESLVLKAEMKTTSLGVQLYCGEFGCYKKTPAADRMEWIRDVVSILKDRHISYSYWEYKAGFGFCDSQGNVIEQEVLDLLTK